MSFYLTERHLRLYSQVFRRSRAPVRWSLRSRWSAPFCADILWLFLQNNRRRRKIIRPLKHGAAAQLKLDAEKLKAFSENFNAGNLLTHSLGFFNDSNKKSEHKSYTFKMWNKQTSWEFCSIDSMLRPSAALRLHVEQNDFMSKTQTKQH